MQLPAHDFLERLGLPYRRMSFPPATEKGAANVARALGFRERQMIKTLIFETDRGERLLVMVGGDQNVVSGLLKKAVGSRNIRMAAPDAVLEATGYAIGSVPPFGWQPPTFRSFIDQSLLDEAELGVGTGQWGEEIIIRPIDLIRAARAIVVNLTDPTRDVASRKP
jgi:Cys-tRNA(Pro)/Cys-tRNA(Cys) deacylase